MTVSEWQVTLFIRFPSPPLAALFRVSSPRSSLLSLIVALLSSCQPSQGGHAEKHKKADKIQIRTRKSEARVKEMGFIFYMNWLQRHNMNR